VPVPVAAGETPGETMPGRRGEAPQAALGQAGGSDRV
jgi:hypothetical protein